MASLSDMRYAGFWLRFVAAILDLVALAIPLSVFVSFLALACGTPLAFLALRPREPPGAVIAAFGKPALIAMLCFFVLSGWLYFSLMESSRWQATIGKRVFGLYVSDLRGTPVNFGRASVRLCGGRLLFHVPAVGGAYFAIDCICAGLTSRKQAVHDLMAGCLVLRKNEGVLFRE